MKSCAYSKTFSLEKKRGLKWFLLLKKRRFNYLCLVCVLGLLTWTSCSSELNVIGEWKDIPVVYALLDPVQDTPTYIRIERVYLPPSQSALEVAQIPDSIYYNPNDIEVLLYEDEILLDTLVWINLNAVGIDREPGIYSSVNYAYSTTAAIQGSSAYRLQINNKVTKKRFSATTQTMSPSNYILTSPSTSLPLKWVSYDTLNNTYTLRFIHCNWTIPNSSDNAEKVYDLHLDIHYKEYEVDLNVTGEPEIPGTAVCKTLRWTPLSNYLKYEQGGLIRKTLNAESFYRFLARELAPVNSTNTRRCMVDIDIEVVAGDVELAVYIAHRNSMDNLAAGLYPPSPFSNVNGGLGVFSNKRSTSKTGYALSEKSLEYLLLNEFTANLGFKQTQCQC